MYGHVLEGPRSEMAYLDEFAEQKEAIGGLFVEFVQRRCSFAQPGKQRHAKSDRCYARTPQPDDIPLLAKRLKDADFIDSLSELRVGSLLIDMLAVL
jgi:hypothetical protein